jgi:uncharacterized protein (DUF2237 family)
VEPRPGACPNIRGGVTIDCDLRAGTKLWLTGWTKTIAAGEFVSVLVEIAVDGGRPAAARNVLGEPLEICSIKPMTGFYRDGCCNTGREDVGSHTVCVVMTAPFLEFSKSRGNDLSTPVPEFGFTGLKPGDRWCLCAPRWQEAFEADRAPRVVLRATHQEALAYCSLADLKRLAVDLS